MLVKNEKEQIIKEIKGKIKYLHSLMNCDIIIIEISSKKSTKNIGLKIMNILEKY